MAAPAPVGGGGRVSIATTADYAEAQRVVDRLSDEGFPVEHTVIVGSELRLVEQVTGRLTVARAALSGAASGAAIGLFIGLLFGLFAFFDPVSSALALGLWGLLFGAVLGAIVGAVGHAATRGRRDFSSVSGLAPTRYEVLVDAAHAERAKGIVGVREVT